MKNWKTTLFGWLGGISIGSTALVDAYNAGAFSSDNIVQLVLAAAFVLMGAFAKDKNVTGGNIRQ